MTIQNRIQKKWAIIRPNCLITAGEGDRLISIAEVELTLYKDLSVHIQGRIISISGKSISTIKALQSHVNSMAVDINHEEGKT